MSETTTFIHAADLHLGAPFRGLRALSDRWADRLLQSVAQSYDRVIQLAIDQQVDFVVMSGDIFDQAHPSYADFLSFFEGLSRLDEAGIPAYLCTGNHDPYVSWTEDYAELPGNTYLFAADKPSFTVFSKNGKPLVLLGGRGYYNAVVSDVENIAEGVTRQEAERATGVYAPFAVGVLHTGLDLDPNKAPVSRDQLLSSGMDYWALGHIHRTWQDDPDNPRLVFSGCIQGRDIKETGPRGVYKVTLREGMPNVIEFMPTASVVWQMLDIDISECITVAQAQEKVTARLFKENGRAHCDEMVERITLTGRTDLHSVLAKPGVIDDFRKALNESYPLFFCDALIDHTQAPYNYDSLRREGLFPSVVLRQVQTAQANDADMVAFLQERFLDKGLLLPRDVANDVQGITAEAQEFLLDILGGGEGA